VNTEYILSNHQQTELERLRAGYDGCGCLECQELYNTIDLSVYGDRIINTAESICVIAGRTGADKWREYHKNGDKEGRSELSVKTHNQKFMVSKIVSDEISVTPPKTSPNTDIGLWLPPVKGGRGRPRLESGGSRMTQYRRRKQEQQGVLVQ
jgi:hypothetical protein